MASLNRIDITVTDLLGNVAVGSTVEFFLRGAQANGNQTGTTINVHDPGSIVAGSSVQINGTGTTHVISSVTATTVVFPSSVTVVDNDRLVRVLPVATVYTDAVGGTVAGALATDANGRITGIYGYWQHYDVRVSGGVAGGSAFGTTLIYDYIPLSDLEGVDIINVKAYGAVGDNVTDDSAAIQRAIDRANQIHLSGSPFGGAVVYFPMGQYRIASTVAWKRGAYLLGAGTGANDLTQILWNGAAGGTMIDDNAGGSTFGPMVMEGICLREGSAVPAICLKIDGQVDWFSFIRHCNFLGASGNLVEFNGGWVNLHIYDCRFDKAGDHAILLKPNNGQHLATFSLKGFTYDSSVRAGNGIVKVDNTAFNNSNIGTVIVENGRIEYTGVPMNDPSAIIRCVGAAVGGNPRWVHPIVRDVTLQDVVGTSPNIEVIRLEGTTTSLPYMIQNLLSGDINTVLGGNWTTGYKMDAPVSVLIQSSHGQAEDFHIVEATFMGDYFDGTQKFLRSRVAAAANDRWNCDPLGTMQWGGGTSAEDITLKRAVAGVLQVSDGALSFQNMTAVASGATINPAEGNFFNVTGTTTITSITTAAEENGRILVLKFDGNVQVTDGGNIVLAGNFNATADDTLVLISNGTNWYELARSAN